jgi:RHS repeat-associated protein
MMQYIYDAEGARVAKGMIATWSCDTTQNGFTPTKSYVLGPSNEQLSETDGQGNWLRTNVYAAGTLVATYDVAPTGSPALHFQLEDWLLTRRVQTNITGTVEEWYVSLPYGDGLTPIPNLGCLPSNNCYSEDPTEHHFTGKERDTESGNDYFEARYYASSMGRFMSPDWSAKEEPVPYAKLDDPQTLNLYAYVGNNPMDRVDADGHAGCKDTPELCKAVRDAVSAGQSIVNGWMNYLSSKISSNSSNSTNSQTPTANSGHAAGGFNKQAYANSVESHAGDKSTGYCARACRKGMEAGGLNTAGRPGDAKNYGPFLLKNGFGVVPSMGYFGHEQSGDTAVFQPVPGHSQSGHIETWTGSHWTSDFKQNHFSPYRGYDASDLDFKIYRHE